LIVPDDVACTAKKIATFALGIPEFNYVVGSKMCHDRVRNKLVLETALKACARNGAPAGREQNASFVRAFYAYDGHRQYSEGRYFDSYNGFFPISRDVRMPTKPTFTVIENKQQIPVVLCGWKSVPLDFTQRRIVSTVYENGLFSYGAYRHSPGEIVFFPESETDEGWQRFPEVWRRGEYGLLTTGEIKDLLELYALAQEAAIPIIKDRWEEKQRRRREKENETQPDAERPSLQINLFEPR
jgi:hypothetical protein